ncbi:MAG: hypothetical protein K940chlam9_00870, partial [Chlamydiae bacterium]|nr:hypothetical protein [Chlamydiota bacterium]
MTSFIYTVLLHLYAVCMLPKMVWEMV